MEKIVLGQTGIKVSKIGFGVLPIGPSQLCLPVDEGAKLLSYAFSQGINFIDTAEYYKTYPYISRFLEILREEGQSSDDLVFSSKSLTSSYEEMEKAIEDACRAIGRDYIDIFLLHEVRTGQFAQRQGAWEALIEGRKKGKIKAIGLSTHHINVVDDMASNPDCDLVFPLLNFKGMGIRKGVMNDGVILDQAGSPEDMLSAIGRCHREGKGVFTMKALGGGNLTPFYRAALDFVLSRPEVDALMLGFGSYSDVDDALAFLSGNMADSYVPDFSQKRVQVNHEDCEGCGSCFSACASGAISFSKENGLAVIDQSKCITCGYCAYACPVRAIVMY